MILIHCYCLDITLLIHSCYFLSLSVIVSGAPKQAPIARKYDSRHELEEVKSVEQQKEELLNSMVDKLGNFDDDPLPQDLQEGVDDDEWDD